MTPLPAPGISIWREEVLDRLTEAGLNLVASGDLDAGCFVEQLGDLAVALEDAVQRPRSGGQHWLCQVLADVADAVDPALVATQLADSAKELLEQEGLNSRAAFVVAWGLQKLIEQGLLNLAPGGQLCFGLRVLALLLCPNPDACPAEQQLSVLVLTAALGLADEDASQ